MTSKNSVTVSVVIPFYGDPTPTIPLVHQLAAQIPVAPLEIIVADDDSPIPFPADLPVHIVKRHANGGFGSAVNAGAAAATGDLLLILNSDLEVSPDFVSKLVAAARPWQPCVASPALDEPGRPNPVARRWPRIRHYVFSWLVPLARFHENQRAGHIQGHDTRSDDGAQPTDWVVGAAMLIPRKDFEAVGGFDERFFMNSEEVDLQRRLQQRGVRSVYLPEVQVQHEGGGSTGSHRRVWLTEGWFHYEFNWGSPRRLKASLLCASFINLGWNVLRRLRRSDIHPWTEFRQETSIVKDAWSRATARRSAANQ